jgi:hypothetical protein
VPDSFPEMSQGDIETATIFTRAMRKIQGKFSGIVSDISGKAAIAGQTFTGDIAAPTVKANNYVIDYEPLAGRTSFSDYQSGGITLTGNSSDWSIGNAYVKGAINGGTYLLYIGGGYILPKNYSGTVTYNADIQSGLFNIYFESSVDNINWVTLVTSGSNYGQNKSESYTFDGLTSATALRFRFKNANGTPTSANRLSNLKISGLDVAYSLIGNASGNTFKDINVAGKANFTAMPQVGGDPIVESGSNADGEWTRWSDGAQIAMISNANGEVSAGPYTWTYPAAFNAAPTYAAGQNITRASGSGAGLALSVAIGQNGIDSRTATDLDYHTATSSSTATPFAVALFASGRWK